MAKWFNISLVLLFLPVFLYSQNQNIKFEHISIEQGLSNNILTGIIQDDVGFMWFATENGLNKYDGYEFTVYRTIPTDSTSLSNSFCRDLYLDNEGVLWIATLYGLNKYDRKADRFIRYYDPRPEAEKVNTNSVLSLFCPDSINNEILWLGTEDGLYKFNTRSELYEPYFTTKQAGLGSGAFVIWDIARDFYGNFWMATNNALYKFNEQRGVITPFPINGENQKRANIWGLCLDQSGILWFGNSLNEDGLIRIDPGTETYRRYQHDPDNPNSISSNIITRPYTDSSGDLWIPTHQGGLNKFNRETEHFNSFQHDKSIPNTISNNSVESIYEDKSHVFWTGNYLGGINKFDRRGAIFNQLQQNITNSINLFNVSVTGIAETQENRKYLWIGTWGDGLLRLNQENGNIVQFRNDPANPNSLSHDIITRLATYSNKYRKELWISTIYGLNKLDLKTGKFTRYYHNPNDSNSPSSDVIRSLFIDKEGLIWLGTYYGMLDKFDSEKDQFKHIDINSDDIFSFCEDHNGNLWIAEDDRLIKLDKDKETFTTFFHNPDDPTGLSYPEVITIYESQINDKYFLWIGTGGGLNRFDYETEKFTHFNELKGSPNERIYSILEDKHGNLWLGGNSGLYKFNPRKGSFRKYDTQDGLYQNQFNWSSHLKSSDGKFLFGGKSGITAFYPDSIKDNPHVPPIVITDFQIFNEPVSIRSQDSDQEEDRYHLPQHISTLNEITLSYKESIFSFEFAALDYHSPQKNQYAYMIEGVDPDWVYTDASRRFASYTNLDPGEYIFRVKGSNNDGIWNEEGTSIKITILPPWWRTNWAYSFYVLVILSMIYGIWRFQTNRLKMKHEMEMEHFEAEKLREVDHLKSHFFANISHEFRTPLTLILGPIQQMLSGEFKGNLKEQYQMILRYGNRLLNLINQILDLSKLESGRMKLKVSCTEVTQFLKGIVQSFSSLAERKHIILGFKTELESISGYVDKDKLEKIVINLLSNAFKFTPEGGEVIVDLDIPPHVPALPAGRPSKGGNAESPFAKGGHRGILISIFNSGAGIPADQLDKIFDRFYQADNSYTKDSEGSGIGLALTKELVEAHHGEIRVESELNKGTTFTVWLPIERENFKLEEIVEEPVDVGGEQRSPLPIAHDGEKMEVETIEAMPLTQPAVAPKSAPLLLIVEDNLDVTTYISSFLEKDYRIITAENGREGLKKALDEFPDLVISDVMMPVMDGFELCKRLKSDQRTSHIPVILLTAKADMESKIEGLEFGADDYVTKPFDAKELHARAKNLIEQRKILREKFSRMIEVKPGEITASSMDEQFLERLLNVFEDHVDESDFSTEDFAHEVGMSRSNLHRKLQALTNQPTHEFLRTLRLKRAAQLLKQTAGTVTEIAYAVGFTNPSHFSKIFRQQFGQSPSEFANRNSTTETSEETHT